ncbi:cytochrome C [Paracoccus sp. MC1862]|nr:cytochrome C [Paracoccus sp. MC1862]MBB1497805.1 cytochrome C [Paracoccus sp. MC1862]QQO46279.1 cytochrome C [Paracoccus sp. MC1862]
MKTSLIATLATLALSLPVAAQELSGDPAAGESEFRKCKACHMIQDEAGTDIVKGGRTGPNLYGVYGRAYAAEEGYKYGEGLLELAETNPGQVWDEEHLIEYVTDPTAYVKEKTGDPAAKSKMTFKLNKNQADIVAFLAQHSPNAAGAAGGDAAAAGGDAAAAPAAAN